VAVLVILAICIAASANFPVLVLSLFWRRFNTGGVIGGMALGLVSSVSLALIGPGYLGGESHLAVGQSNSGRFADRKSWARCWAASLRDAIMSMRSVFSEVTFRIQTGP